MEATGTSVSDQSRLGQLLAFLEHDPGNLHLLRDAAAAALDEGDETAALPLIDRLEELGAPRSEILNLKGLAALGAGRPQEAAAFFQELAAAGEADPTPLLNLAWALTLAGDHEAALPLMDGDVLALGASAAGLRIRLLHHLGRLDEAMEEGARFAGLYPDDPILLGTLATAALDADRPDLARAYAERAGSHHDGLSTMGLLLLDEDRLSESAALFDRVLAADRGNPRALLGKGLERLAAGDLAQACGCLDRAAELFGDHLGSWIAAGWAHYLGGAPQEARARFEHALSLDDNFAESHGGLAVLDIAEGKIEEGRRRADVALRLDRSSFGAALANLMLLERDGKLKAAMRVREKAMRVPVGIGGRTLAEALAARASRSR